MSPNRIRRGMKGKSYTVGELFGGAPTSERQIKQAFEKAEITGPKGLEHPEAHLKAREKELVSGVRGVEGPHKHRYFWSVDENYWMCDCGQTRKSDPPLSQQISENER